MKNLFHKIDMERWPRAQIYHYFAEMVTTTTYSINVTMDVSILRKTLQNSGVKFFPAYLYLISSVIKRQREFCMSIQDGMFFARSFSPLLQNFFLTPVGGEFYPPCRMSEPRMRLLGPS